MGMKILREKNFLEAAFLVFLIDQATKLWALKFLEFEEIIPLNKYVDFLRIYNESTMFLIETPFGLDGHVFRLFYLLFPLIITFGVYWVIKQPAFKTDTWIEEFGKTGMFLIVGGAWGNAFDRIFRDKGVVDFIQLKISENSWPVLNVADVMVHFGVLSIIISWIIIITSQTVKSINLTNNNY